MSNDDMMRLKLAISEALSERCSCSFSQDNIVDEQFSCNNGPNTNSVLFHGSLIGSQNVDSVELLFYLQEWLLTEPTITLDEFSLHAAENCRVYFNGSVNATNDDCEWPPNKLREYRKFATGIFTGLGLLAMIAMLALAIVVIVCICQRCQFRRRFK